MVQSLVTYEVDGGIALIGLNRPEKRNALSNLVIDELHAAVRAALDEARAGVIFGHGPHFSAGLDLAEWAEIVKSGKRHQNRGRWHPTFDLIARGGVPFVAAISGACVGGGLELASAAQIRVADETAYFALPEGQRGIFVGGGGSVRIQRLLGYARMADMMLTGRTLDAREATGCNLCQYATPAGGALGKARELAARIATNAPLSNWAVCACLPRMNDMSHEDGLFVEGLVGNAVSSPEGVARLDAFVEKRAPKALPRSEEKDA